MNFDAYNASRDEKHRECFCYAPFTNMLFAQDGTVNVCCHNTDFPIGKYPESSLADIWNSPAANELRNYMRNFDLSHGCGICESDLIAGHFNEIRAKHFDHIPRLNAYPTMMEFLVSNKCNLECVMCKGEFSSLIRKNREKLPPLLTPYDDEFLRQLEEFIPYLYETRFSGSGEAFLIDMNYDIWEMIIKRNPECIIMIQTNGTILTDRVKEILNRGKVQIGVSLDSLNKATYESIRLNANFEKVMENIRFFSDYSKKKNIKFSIAMCVMRQNWRELPEFVRFANSLNAVATFHKVWYPRKFALLNLPSQQLTEIYNYLSSFDLPDESNLEKQNKSHYEYIVSVIKNWMEKAPEYEAEAEQVNSLKNNELLIFLESKFRKYIFERSGSEENKTAHLNICMNKIQDLMSRFDNPEILLRRICMIPAYEMAETLKRQSSDFLFEQANKFFRSEQLLQ